MTLKDLAAGGLWKGAAYGALEARPRRLVNLGAQRALELVVGLVRAGEVGVAHEKALTVVVGVDEPAGDVVDRYAWASLDREEQAVAVAALEQSLQAGVAVSKSLAGPQEVEQDASRNPRPALISGSGGRI